MGNQDIILNKQDYLKEKVRNLLSSEQFCGLCYEKGKCFNMLHEKVKIVTDGWTQEIVLMNIYSYVFHENKNLPASELICSECTEQLKLSYIFIKGTYFINGLLESYMNDLESKTLDLITHLDDNAEFENTNIVIVLENVCKFLPERDKEVKQDKVITSQKSDKNDISFRCLECSKELPTLPLWRQHIREYHKQSFKCEICSKTFKNQEYLTMHYKVHSKHRCKLCHLIVSERDLKDHLRKNHENDVFLCDICTDAFYTLGALGKHVKIVHAIKKEALSQCKICLLNIGDNNKHSCKLCPECNGTPCIHHKFLVSYREQILSHVSEVKCLECDYVCSKKEILIGHVNEKHLNHHPYTCDHCEQQYYSKIVLKTHIQKIHKEINTCNYCNVNFRNLVALNSHEIGCKMKKRQYNCERCSASFNTPKELEQHEKLKHKEVFPCGLCSKEFLKESNRKEHIVKAHSALQIKNGRSKLECVICQTNFDSKGELIRHMKRHGPNVKYPCRICNAEYNSLRQLRAHNRKHVGPFATCDICGKEMRKILIAKHLENHKFDGIVNCNICKKSFGNIAILKYHQKSHLDNIPCPKCDKMINPAKLRRHIKVHTMEENPSEIRKQKANIMCELCDYITWNNILLECHMNRHHLKIKPYVCHICSKDFVGKHLLKKHIASHTLDKSVACMVCGKKFANSTCLKMHLRLHTGEKNYPCDVCGEKFRSSSIMNVHKRKKHAEKENACPLCSSKFYTKGELRRHVIQVHWKDKTRKFDPRELKGLENHYDLFHDGRRIKIDDTDVDFYMPC